METDKIVARVGDGSLRKDFCFVLLFDRDLNLLRKNLEIHKLKDRGTCDPEHGG